MFEMPDIASDKDQAVSLGGGGDQTIPVTNRRTHGFPLRSEIAGNDCGRFVQGQHGKVLQHIRFNPFPQLVAGRSYSSAKTDFLQADDRGKQGANLGFEPGLNARIRKTANQFAQNIGIQQIHALFECRRRRAGHRMSFRFNARQNLENWRIVWDAIGIQVVSIRKTLKLAALGTDHGRPMSGEGDTNSLLFLVREAFYQFNNVQSRRTHNDNLRQIQQANKPFVLHGRITSILMVIV